jgi:deoxyadenosine/deoxycytidine kinase
MRRWGFHSQIFFLEERLSHHLRLLEEDSHVIQDRSIYEDAEVFAHNLALLGHLDERDYQVYQRLYAGIRATLQPPTLILYLRARVGTLQRRIEKRGRAYEKAISPTYLAQLNTLYDRWASTFRACPVKTIETDDRDFVGNPEDLDQLAKLVSIEIQHSA